MLLPSPKSSNDRNGAIYITELHNNKKGWELGMPFLETLEWSTVELLREIGFWNPLPPKY